MADDPDARTQTMRDDAEKKLAGSPKCARDLTGQTAEELIHELRVHQIELETQAEELRESHLALEESRDKFLDLYEFAPLGYLTLNDKALVTDANLACATLLGVERSKLEKARFRKFVAQKDSEQWVLYFMNALNRDGKQTCTLTLIRGDGSTFPARLESIRLTGSDGVIKVRFALSDITDIWQIEALRKSEEKFRLISESSPDHIFIQDRDLRYIWVLNPQLGLMPEDMIGKTDYDILSKEDADLVTTVKRRVLETGKTIPYEISLPSSLGATEYFEGVYLPKYDNEGRINGVRGYFRNITGRKVAEEVLQQSELLFREVFNNANDAVFLLERTPDGPGKYLLVNDKAVQMLGYSKEEFLEMSPRDIVPEDIAKKIMPAVMKKLQIDRHATFESAHRKQDGSIYPVEVSTHTFRYKGRDVDLSIVRDITGRKRAEETIRQSEEKFRLVVENDPDAIFIQTEGQFAYVNPAACLLFGAKSADLLVGKPVLDRFHPDFREIVKERIHVLNDERQPVVRIEEMYLRLDGTPFDVEVSAVPMTYLQKDGALVFFNDITERKVAEEALKASETQHRATLEATADGILAVDNEGKVLKVSRRFAEIWKIPQSIMDCGDDKTLLDFVLGQLTYPDAFLKKVQSLYGSDAEDMDILTFKDGRVLERYTSPMIMDGACIGRVWSFRDVTKRKRAEDALRESELKYRSLIESSSDAIFCVNQNGEYKFTNLVFASTFDKTPDYFIGKTFWDIYPKEHADYRQLTNLAVFETGVTQTIEVEVPLLDTTLYFIAKANPIKDETGKVILNLTHATDITERKRAEEAIRQANRKLTLLSSITRHDINNQLTVLRGYLTILEEQQPDATNNEYFLKVNTATKRIAAMIQFTKEYEQIGVNVPVWQDFHSLVETAAKQAPLGKVMVKNDLPAGAEVFADPLVVKVFYNLMDNAVRYGGKITSIRFSVEAASDEHLIVCEDDGDGIIAEEKEKIFERGFGKNTGLGLALSREILSITGITITETGEPGKGARFEMTVPKGAWRITGTVP